MKKYNIHDNKKIIKSLSNIEQLARHKLFEEINESFEPNSTKSIEIQDLKQNEKDIFRKSMYEIAHSLSIYSKEEDIKKNLSTEAKKYIENAYSTMSIDPVRYRADLKGDEHIVYEANISVNGTDEQVKAMKGVLLGGDISVTVDGKKIDMMMNAHNSYDRNIESSIEIEIEKFLHKKFNSIKKEIENEFEKGNK